MGFLQEVSKLANQAPVRASQSGSSQESQGFLEVLLDAQLNVLSKPGVFAEKSDGGEGSVPNWRKTTKAMLTQPKVFADAKSKEPGPFKKGLQEGWQVGKKGVGEVVGVNLGKTVIQGLQGLLAEEAFVSDEKDGPTMFSRIRDKRKARKAEKAAAAVAEAAQDFNEVETENSGVDVSEVMQGLGNLLSSGKNRAERSSVEDMWENVEFDPERGEQVEVIEGEWTDVTDEHAAGLGGNLLTEGGD